MRNRSVIPFTLACALAVAVLTIQTPAGSAAPQVWSPQWNHANVDGSVNDVGYHSSIAFNPVNGWPYISSYDATNGKLRLAYLADGRGTSCGDGWNCFAVAGSGYTQAGSDNQL